MNSLSFFRAKHFCVLILTVSFFLSVYSAQAQCYNELYTYQVSPYGPLCSPQYVTVRAEIDNYNYDWVYGQFQWYTSETDPNPVYSEWVSSGDETITSDYGTYASDGAAIWVSFYNYYTGCQSDRIPYYFYISPTPSLYQNYASQCGYNPLKIQLSSNTQGVYFNLYKYSEYYDPTWGYVQNYDLLQSNTTGYFEVSDFDPADQNNYYAKVVQSYGCSEPYYYQLWLEVVGSTPPTITGNLNITSGSSTTLYANGNAPDYKWYDGAGNYITDGYAYTTPSSLTDNTYTYQVRAASSDGSCVTDPAFVTVSVNQPSISYSSLYNSSNFTKSIDLSKPVGTVNGAPAASSTGAITYSIPIYAPPGTNGMQPSVNVTYSSQSGNGIAGYGWNIGGISVIGRNGKDMFHNGSVSPVAYTSDDAFILDGVRLNPISGSNGANGTIYAAETENFASIVSNGSSANNPDWFKVTAKDGTVMEFGNSSDSRILTDDGANVMLWRLSKITDINGNYVQFKYDNGYRDSRIDEIDYTANANTGLAPYNSIKFNYDVRSDVVTNYISGASFTSKHILNTITVKNDGNLVKTYQFNYGFDNLYSLLKEVVESGSDGTSLNSTIFLYGDNPTGFVREASSVVAGSAVDVYTGDFNGDGISDILACSYQYSNFIKYNTDYTVYLRNSQNTGFQQQYTLPLNTTWQVISSQQIPYGRNFISSDFDGDGRDDILLTQSHLTNNYFNQRRIDNIQINFSKDAPTNYTSTSYTFPTVTSYVFGTGTANLVDPAGTYIIPGDFNGDGASDFITIFTSDVGGYYCFFNSPRAGISNAFISMFGPSESALMNANNIQPIDFDGDGKMELLVTIGSTSYVVGISPYIDPFWGTSGYRMDNLYQTTSINNNCKIFPGDFNGDRKTDLLVRNSSGGWFLLYSNGKVFNYQSFGFNQSVNISDDKILVSDFNGDGRSDILHGYNYFQNGVASTSKLSVYYSKGNPAAGFYYEQTDYNNLLGFTPLIVADLNGDGRNDFINRNYYADPFDILYLKPNGKERLLSKVTDGHNVTWSFDYKALTDKTSTPYVYNRTISLDNSMNQYPFNYVQLPLFVAASVTSPNGAGGTNTITYNYEDAIVHNSGKGFLGFKKITAKDVAKGMTSITQNDINTQFAVPYTIKQSTQLTSTGEVLSESDINTSFISLSTGASDPKRYVQHTDKVLTVNYLTGAATESNNTYDNYGNVTTNVTKTGALSGSTVDPTETVTTTTTVSTHNTPVPARPDNVSVSTVRTGASAVNVVTAYTYDGNGNLASQTMFSGLPKAITNNYAHNGFGNVTQTTTAAAGVNTRIVNSTWDSRGRYALTKQTGSSAVSRSESFTYDDKWGKVLSHTSTDCLNTTFEYDGYGRLKKTNLPDNYSITTSLNWDVSGDNVFYEFTSIPGGSPSTKVWYDKLGRQTKKQTAGFNNQWLTQLTTYDAKGNVASGTNNYYSGETPLTTTNSYDNYNRLQSTSNALNTNSYTYSLLGGGKLQVTTQNAAGQSSSKVTDATGKVVASIDAGGEVDLAYNSGGKQVQVIHGGTILTTTDYDSYGRLATVTDKNAGSVTYTYDAFGQLTQQSDNNGNTVNMTYDDFGRVISRQGPEGTTTYEYYKDNSTGCSNNNIAKITGFNGVVKQYTYNSTKRLQSEKVTIDGTDYTTQYSYNGYGNLVTTTYPSGVVVNNNYDNNGQLVSITGGNAASPTTLFTGTQVNGFGQYTGYTLGNNRAGQNTYNYGIPTRFYTPGIQDLNLTYDYTKNTMLSRQDAVKGITESFQYDNLNRLTQSSVNSVAQININYDNNAGHSYGNIVSKTDAGNYVYKNDKVNAVAYITNPAGATNPPVTISTTDQVIAYTPFMKTASITEGVYQESFTYDAAYERVKTALQQNGTPVETRYFLGDYEKQVTTTTTREIHYVTGGNGLCAIIVRENGVNNFYFVYSDHLGSLLTLTDINGNVVAEQNFDPWGRNRNPNTWQYASVPTVPGWLYRGFTGHEHLPQFALINMNGRMYDPIQGRMLSPDNYATGLYGTQGYNRYSYGNNNPLTYVDRDGNFVWAPILIAIAIGAGTSAGIYSLTALANNNWTLSGFLKATAMGAVSGAIGGTIAQAGISLGVSAQSIGLNIISNVGAQVGTNLAFGNHLTWGLLAGAVAGGFISQQAFGNFTGVHGGQLANMGAELGFNAAKYGVAGGIGGALGAMIDGGDVRQGFVNGAKNGALAGVAVSSLNIMLFGPTYKPDRQYFADLGKNNPVYRSGTFITHALFYGGAVTLGRNIVVNKIPGDDDRNTYLEAHETAHYYEEMTMGFGKMYLTTLQEYIKYGASNTYGTFGTLEYEAQVYAATILGYYYTSNDVRITGVPIH